MDSKISITWESGYTQETRTFQPHVTVSSLTIGVVHQGDTTYYNPPVNETIQEPKKVSGWDNLPTGLNMKWQSLFNNNLVKCCPSDTIITTINYAVREKQLSVDDVVNGQITYIKQAETHGDEFCVTNTELFITDRLVPIVFAPTLEDYTEVVYNTEIYY